jgi:hypothetical protein
MRAQDIWSNGPRHSSWEDISSAMSLPELRNVMLGELTGGSAFA